MEQNQENFTQTIYRLAKEQKEEELRKFLQEQGKSVGAVSGKDSAISLLARDGATKAVNFLIEKFDASLNWALLGAAKGGYNRLDLINSLLAQGAMINYGMYGASIAKDERLVNYLEAKGASKDWAVHYTTFLKCTSRLQGEALLDDAGPENLQPRIGGSIVSLCNMSLAAAQVGNEVFFNRLLQISNSMYVDPYALNPYRYGATGAFLGDQKELCTEFSKYFGDQFRYHNYYSGLYSNAADGAGQGGHLNLINQILHLINPENTEHVLHHALLGAAKGDQLELIPILLSMGAKLTEVFFTIAADAGNLNILNKYLDKFAENEKIYNEIVTHLKDKSHISSNPDEVLRVASFLNDSKLRRLFIETAYLSNTDDKIDVDSLYRKATILNGLMREHQINYNQALVWNSPGMRQWLLQDKPLLPDELVFKITHLATSLTHEEATELGLKINAYYLQQRGERLLRKEESSLQQKGQSVIAQESESKESGQDIKKPNP